MPALAIGRLAIAVKMAPKKIIFNKLNNNDRGEYMGHRRGNTSFCFYFFDNKG